MKFTAISKFTFRDKEWQAGDVLELDDATGQRLSGEGLVKQSEAAAVQPSPVAEPAAVEKSVVDAPPPPVAGETVPVKSAPKKSSKKK